MEGRGVHLAERQLCITAAARGEDETIEDGSRADDCSPSLIFKLTSRDLRRNGRSPSQHVQHDTRRCDRGRRSRSGREGSVRPTN